MTSTTAPPVDINNFLTADGIVSSMLSQTIPVTIFPELKDACLTAHNLVAVLGTEGVPSTSRKLIQLSCTAVVVLVNTCQGFHDLYPEEKDYIQHLVWDMKALNDYYKSGPKFAGLFTPIRKLGTIHRSLERRLLIIKTEAREFCDRVIAHWDHADIFALQDILHGKLETSTAGQSDQLGDSETNQSTYISPGTGNTNSFNTSFARVRCNTFNGVMNGNQTNNNGVSNHPVAPFLYDVNYPHMGTPSPTPPEDLDRSAGGDVAPLIT